MLIKFHLVRELVKKIIITLGFILVNSLVFSASIKVKTLGNWNVDKVASNKYKVETGLFGTLEMNGIIKSKTSYSLSKKANLGILKKYKVINFLTGGIWTLNNPIIQLTSGGGLAIKANVAPGVRLAPLVQFLKLLKVNITKGVPVTMEIGDTGLTFIFSLFTHNRKLTLVPGLGTKINFHNMSLKCYVNLDKSIQISLESTLKVKPTKWDPELEYSPEIAYNILDQSIALNASLIGKWHKPFGFMPVSIEGAALSVTFLAGVPVAFGIGIEKAKFLGETFTGKFLVDLKKAETTGMQIKASKIPLNKLLFVLGKIKNLQKFIPSAAYLKDVEVFISPTGGAIGRLSFPPGFKLKGSLKQFGVVGIVDASAGFTTNTIVDASFKGEFDIQDMNRYVENGVNKVPLLGSILKKIVSTFQFKYLSIAMGLKGNKLDSSANISFKIFGKDITIPININIAFNPVEIGKMVVHKIKEYAQDLGLIMWEGLKIAGKQVAKYGKIAVNNVSKGMKWTGSQIADKANKAWRFFKGGWNSFAGLFKWKPNRYEKNLYRSYAENYICLKVTEDSLKMMDQYLDKIKKSMEPVKKEKDRKTILEKPFLKLKGEIIKEMAKLLKNVNNSLKNYYLEYFKFWATSKYEAFAKQENIISKTQKKARFTLIKTIFFTLRKIDHFLVKIKNVSKALHIVPVNKYQLIWNDYKSGAWLDGAYFKPIAPIDNYSGAYFILGHVGHPSHNTPNFTTYAVKSLQKNAVRHPLKYIKIWDDSGSGASKNIFIWRPVAPVGYVALGDVATTKNYPPGIREIVCIRKDLVEEASIGGLTWFDRRSGANRSVGSWNIIPRNSLGYFTNLFYAHASHDIPKSKVYVLRKENPFSNSEYFNPIFGKWRLISLKDVKNNRKVPLRSNNFDMIEIKPDLLRSLIVWKRGNKFVVTSDSKQKCKIQNNTIHKYGGYKSQFKMISKNKLEIIDNRGYFKFKTVYERVETSFDEYLKNLNKKQ